MFEKLHLSWSMYMTEVTLQHDRTPEGLVSLSILKSHCSLSNPRWAKVKRLLAFAPNFKELYPEVGPPFFGRNAWTREYGPRPLVWSKTTKLFLYLGTWEYHLLLKISPTWPTGPHVGFHTNSNHPPKTKVRLLATSLWCKHDVTNCREIVTHASPPRHSCTYSILSQSLHTRTLLSGCKLLWFLITVSMITSLCAWCKLSMVSRHHFYN